MVVFFFTSFMSKPTVIIVHTRYTGTPRSNIQDYSVTSGLQRRVYRDITVGLSVWFGGVFLFPVPGSQLWKNALRSSYGGALSWCVCTSWKGGMFSECAPLRRAPGGPNGRL